jgi:hypothetical protein
MLITRFMLGGAGISCLEMPGEAMNLNIHVTSSPSTPYSTYDGDLLQDF